MAILTIAGEAGIILFRLLKSVEITNTLIAAFGLLLGCVALGCWYAGVYTTGRARTRNETSFTSQGVTEVTSQLQNQGGLLLEQYPASPSSSIDSLTTNSLGQSTPLYPEVPKQPAVGKIATHSVDQKNERVYMDKDIRYFILPKDDVFPEHCQDKVALNNEQRRYAVTDGVSRSFVPGQWAQIIASHYVKYKGEFPDKKTLEEWLTQCSAEWLHWIHTTWIPDANKKKRRSEEDWEKEINKGAQTTLIGCSLLPNQDGSFVVKVDAVGDANFFLFKPSPASEGDWTFIAFPWTEPDQFGVAPRTWATTPEQIQRAWDRLKSDPYTAYPGSYIILATDTLAHWILTQIKNNSRSWIKLLNINTESKFKMFIQQERAARHMEDDDMTMMVIPL